MAKTLRVISTTVSNPVLYRESPHPAVNKTFVAEGGEGILLH